MNIGLLEQLENPGGAAVSCGTNCRIYTTANTYQGDLGGAAGADSRCNSDPGRPPSSTKWKAMIGATPERTACTSADCGVGGASENFNWALRPNTSYRRSDGVFIGVTNGNAIFTFPLQTNLDPNNGFVWTGLTGAWQPSSGCTTWSVKDSTLGATGDGSFASAVALFTSNSNCSSSQKLYCAEQ